ncbi:MAG: RDD family protein [Reichenbachiella sp.]
MSKKQFDYSKHVVADELQTMELASFARRSIAFGIDWLIVIMVTELFWVLIPLSVLWLFIKGKGKSTIRYTSIKVNQFVARSDRKLESMDIEQKLRMRFKRSMTSYIHVLIYLPIILSTIVLIVITSNAVAPDLYQLARTETLNLPNRFQSITDLLTGFNWIFGAINGLVYFSLFTWKWNGQTPGKKFLGIKVVKLNGTKITLFNSAERSSGYTASSALIMIGFFQFFWEKNHQTTHDKISETVVVKA